MSDEVVLCVCCVQVGADGFQSAVRRAAEMGTIQWTHKLSALVGTIHWADVRLPVMCNIY